MTIDPRITPARPDLAAAQLRGTVRAAGYVDGQPAVVTAEVLDMRDTPDLAAALSTQLLWGEPVTVYEPDAPHGFAWVQSDVDRYVGYVPVRGIAQVKTMPTHLVTGQAAQLYAEPALKRPPVTSLPGNAQVQATSTADGYVQLGDLWCPAQQLTALTELAGDYVSMAERYLGLPYLWGGRSSRGLDCSALVQLSLAAVGITAPRDSDMQQVLGREVPQADQRGDLVCWRGHIGIMLDETRLLHANAHHMACVVEPLAEAVARIAAGATGPVLTVRRL